MTRTHVKDRTTKYRNKGYKRTNHKHGHCYVCGYDSRKKGYKKTAMRNFLKFHGYPYLKNDL